jgi:hypothetical protein
MSNKPFSDYQIWFLSHIVCLNTNTTLFLLGASLSSRGGNSNLVSQFPNRPNSAGRLLVYYTCGTLYLRFYLFIFSVNQFPLSVQTHTHIYIYIYIFVFPFGTQTQIPKFQSNPARMPPAPR